MANHFNSRSGTRITGFLRATFIHSEGLSGEFQEECWPLTTAILSPLSGFKLVSGVLGIGQGMGGRLRE